MDGGGKAETAPRTGCIEIIHVTISSRELNVRVWGGGWRDRDGGKRKKEGQAKKGITDGVLSQRKLSGVDPKL